MNLHVTRKTRAYATALLAVALTMTLSSCGHSAATSGNGVSYGGQSIVPDLVFRGQDWGEPHGIEIEQTKFQSGSEAFEAVLSGEVNISNGGSGRLITIASQRPEEIQLIAKWQYGGSRYSLLTPEDSSIKSPSDLRGKTIAVDNGSGAYTLLLIWLEQNGLSIDDLKVIQTKISDIGAVLQSGSADIGVAWEPTASLLASKGLVERFATLESAGQSPNFLIADRSWAEENEDKVVAFLRSVVDVADLIENDPKTAGSIAAEVSKAEGVVSDSASLAESLTYIEMAPEIDQDSLDELTHLAEEMVAEKKIQSVPDFAGLVNSSYLEKAMNQ